MEDKSESTALQRWRYVYVGISAFQCIIAAGACIGWNSLIPIFLQEGIYNEYCAPGESTCTAQTNQFNFVYTVSSSCSLISNVILGVVFDKLGPRTCKLTSLLLVIWGSIFISGAHSRRDPKANQFDFLLYGMAILSIGGNGILLSSLHFSNLFPRHKSIITSMLVGALHMSFYIFEIFNILCDTFNMRLQAVFLYYTVLLAPLLGGVFFFDPDVPYEYQPSQMEVEMNLEQGTMSSTDGTSVVSPLMGKRVSMETGSEVSAFARESPREEHVPDRYHGKSFREQALSPPFLCITVFFSVIVFWCNYYIGNMYDSLNGKGFDKEEIERLMHYLGAILPGSVFLVPVIGFLLHHYSFDISSGTILLTGFGYFFTFLARSSLSVTISFIFYTFHRTFIFTFGYDYLSHKFGFQNYGQLTGLLWGLAAVLGLLQTPVDEMSSVSRVETLQVLTLLCTSVLPLYEFWSKRHQH